MKRCLYGVLSLDVGTELPGLPQRYASSAAQVAQPCARNVLVISRAPGETSADPLIRYGDKIVLSTTKFLKSAAKIRQDILSLSSQLITPFVFAKTTHFQEVCFTTVPASDFGNHWQIVYYDPKFRLEMEGMPVLIGKPLILNHCKTNAHLGSGTEICPNDFGNEHEVFCKCILDQHKAEQPENLWTLEDSTIRGSSV